MPDRLDDGDADVAGLLLDGVDHRLDALPHDHRLDFDHPAPLPGPNKKASRPPGSRGSFAPAAACSGAPPLWKLPPAAAGGEKAPAQAEHLTFGRRAPSLRGPCCSRT